MSRHDPDYETDEEILEDEYDTPETPPARPTTAGDPPRPPTSAAPPARTVAPVAGGAAARRAVRPPAAPPARRDPTQSRRSAGGPPRRPPAQAAAPRNRNWMIWGGLGTLALVAVVVGGLAFSGMFNPQNSPVAYPTADPNVVTGTPNYTPPPDNVVARVNGRPITGDDWQRRIATDKANFLSDPLFAMTANNFEGITGTRMLDLVHHDSLDKLINFEVIQLEAEKEGMIPKPDEQQEIIRQGKEHDLKDGKSFEEFLREKGITEEQYNRTIVGNVIYAAMADKHVVKQGNADMWINSFMEWVCKTRQNYKVDYFVTFAVENPPCTSGLPSDIPIAGLPTPVEVPEFVPTGPAGPIELPSPQPTGGP